MPIGIDRITDELLERPQDSLAASDVAPGDDERSQAKAEDGVEAVDGLEEADNVAESGEGKTDASRFSWKGILAFAVLPALTLMLVAGTAYLKWRADSAEISQTTATQSTKAAIDGTIAMLSYRPDTIEKDLPAVGDRLTGKFRDQYTQLVNDVVIPGAKQKNISAVAKVPAAASVSATGDHAVVLVFVDQTVTVGNDAPTDTASSVRVTLDKVDKRWLISEFDPV